MLSQSKKFKNSFSNFLEVSEDVGALLLQGAQFVIKRVQASVQVEGGHLKYFSRNNQIIKIKQTTN